MEHEGLDDMSGDGYSKDNVGSTVEQDRQQSRGAAETSMGESEKPAPGESYTGAQHCTFDRRGVCRIHKIKGEKTTQKTKKWSKKKFGFGWTTVTAINYTCTLDKGVDIRPKSGFDEVLRQPSNGNKEYSESLEYSRSLGGAAD